MYLSDFTTTLYNYTLLLLSKPNILYNSKANLLYQNQISLQFT